MEYQVLDPLLRHIQDPPARAFLKTQSLDEKRHGDLIRNYLLTNLSFQKTKPTFSDRIFYSILFPLARRFLFPKAVYAFGILLFYERFSVGLYAHLLKAARRDGLEELNGLVEGILADEGRHIRGLKALLQNPHYKTGASPFVLRAMLSLVSKDVSFERWALHNRDIRRKLVDLAIDPERINWRRKVALLKVTHDCAF